jgi:lysophospholipid acyltransferase (LPLAT)-like uncharacterized protein
MQITYVFLVHLVKIIRLPQVEDKSIETCSVMLLRIDHALVQSWTACIIPLPYSVVAVRSVFFSKG